MTLINVFSVDPSKQQELVDLLNAATEETMKNMPGFISANIHAGVDGKSVINYAQWKSKANFEEMMKNPEAQKHMDEAGKLAQKVEPRICTVAAVHEG